MLSIGNVLPSSEAADAASDGLSHRPPEVAQCAKNRFGHVGPGTEACQWSNTTNSLASAVTAAN